MAISRNPHGFKEYRRLGGGNNPVTRRYRVKADNMPSQIFAGDPVVLVSGNTVVRCPSAATAASLPTLGVVRAVYNSNGRPFTHSLPSGGQYIPVSTAGYVDVNVDPWQTYLVDTDASVNSTLIGQFVDTTADTPNTAAGVSGFLLKLSGAVNTAAANTLQWQVIGIGPDSIDGVITGDAAADVEVILAQPVLGNSNKVR